jgi:hypothetical protein
VFKKGFHENVSLFRQLHPDRGEHLIPYSGHFHPKFPIGGILQGIGKAQRRILPRVVKAGANLAGEEKSPADTDGPDGIEFVGVEQNSGFKGCGLCRSTKAVGTDAVADGFNIGFGIGEISEQGGCEFGTPLGMANLPLALALFLAADIVQKGGGSEDFDTPTHFLANGYGVVQDPLTMVWAM